MKHSHKELYKIEGIQGVFTAEAAKEFYNKYPILDIYLLPANPEPAKGYRKVWMDVNKTTSKIVYTYGEKTWFDTEEERDNYRIEQNKLREEKHLRAVVMQEIKNELAKCDIEELKKFAEILKRA